MFFGPLIAVDCIECNVSNRPSLSVSRKRQALRLQFRPEKVRMLFIGEAPPASGRFFYQGDSGLYRAIRDVFHEVDHSITDENFLCTFQRCGCYLIDVCGSPVDNLDRKPRRAACIAGELLLSRRIRRLQPESIVSLLRAIRGNIERAASRADWHGVILDVPYPGRWARHREIFTAKLLSHVASLIK